VIVFESKPERASQRSLESFARQAQKLAGAKGEISVLLTNARRMHELNRHFRGKNRPTDVLSFPRDDGGDIAVCMEVARENAARYGHSLSQELKILLLHGMLHLAGYDHEIDKGEMAEREMTLRSRLKLPATLIDRVRRERRSERASNSMDAKRKRTARERRLR
jgi:probable rRNA maturation factor